LFTLCVLIASAATVVASAAAAVVDTRSGASEVLGRAVVVHCSLASAPGTVGIGISASTGTVLIARNDATSSAYPPVRVLSLLLRDGREQRVVTIGSELIANPWSPDGKRLGVVLPDGSLAVVEVASGQTTPVMKPMPGARIAFNAWSPDGENLIITETTGSDPSLIANSHELLLVRVANGTRRDLGPGRGGVISPDGRRVAFFTKANASVLDFGTGARIALSALHGNLQSPITWSPNSKMLSYTDEAVPGAADVVLVNADGSGARVVGEADGGTPLWARDALVAGYRSGKGVGGIAVFTPSTGLTHVLDPATALSQRYVAPVGVLPGGTRIVYALRSNGRDGFRSVAIDGRNDAPLVPCLGKGHGDKVYGTPLNDVINVRNGSADTVACGGGHDIVIADRNDKVAPDCELVRR
jgi:hypothetical protein